ncbi:MAG: RHS repeat-associated core domain-containing protein [Myxococcales bacterium]
MRIIVRWVALALALAAPSLTHAQPAVADDAELGWDYRGRLSAVEAGHRAASYVYGQGIDRLLEERDGSVIYHLGPNFEVRDGIAITYTVAGTRRIARTSRSALQTRLLKDLAPSTKPDARIDVGDAWLASKNASATRHLYASARRSLLDRASSPVSLHQDHLGSATLATDRKGQVVGEREFEASGGVAASHGHVDDYGFTGQRMDPATALVHFQHRELDPRVGRWVSPDPLFLADSAVCVARPFECANGYQYVSNNPVDLVDPSGRALLGALLRFHWVSTGVPSKVTIQRFWKVVRKLAKALAGGLPRNPFTMTYVYVGAPSGAPTGAELQEEEGVDFEALLERLNSFEQATTRLQGAQRLETIAEEEVDDEEEGAREREARRRLSVSVEHASATRG